MIRFALVLVVSFLSTGCWTGLTSLKTGAPLDRIEGLSRPLPHTVSVRWFPHVETRGLVARERTQTALTAWLESGQAPKLREGDGADLGGAIVQELAASGRVRAARLHAREGTAEYVLSGYYHFPRAARPDPDLRLLADVFYLLAAYAAPLPLHHFEKGILALALRDRRGNLVATRRIPVQSSWTGLSVWGALGADLLHKSAYPRAAAAVALRMLAEAP